MRLWISIVRIVCLLLFSARMAFAVPEFEAPGIEKNPTAETESPLRRGEVIFFISYPFTFLGSLIVYNVAASGIRMLDTGRSDFSANGGFYALVATTAAFMSFGIAMNDYYAIRTEARADMGRASSYLVLDYRF